MRPIVEELSITTGQSSVNFSWHPLSSFHSSFDVTYTVQIEGPAIATAATINVHATLHNVIENGIPSANAIFQIATTAGDPAIGLAIVSAQSTPVAAIMVAITGVSSDTTGTFRLQQQGV